MPPNHISLPHRSQNQKLSSEEKINSTNAGQTLKVLKAGERSKLRYLFRNTHAIVKYNRPITDYVWLCSLDKAKGIDIGSTYVNKQAPVDFIIPSPTKLRGDIVTLPSVHHNPCEQSRINILQWILTKLGTYLVLKRIWNPIDFQGQRSRSRSNFYRITSL